MKACFIGHRTIQKNEELIFSLRQTIIELINKGVDTFLFGSMSEFDDLSWEVVTGIREKYPHIKRVYVRATYQHIDKSYENYLLKSYEETYFPTNIENAGKGSYIERNYEMINRSAYCIFYYNKDYVAPITQRQNMITTFERNSGTKIAYDYAIKRNKTIINLYNLSECAGVKIKKG